MRHRDVVFNAAGDQAGAAIDTTGTHQSKNHMYALSCSTLLNIAAYMSWAQAHLNFLYRYKCLAEGLAAADRIRVGAVQVRVAGADPVGRSKPHRKVSEARSHVDAIRPDGLGGLQLDMDGPDIAGHLDHIAVF